MIKYLKYYPILTLFFGVFNLVAWMTTGKIEYEIAFWGLMVISRVEDLTYKLTGNK